MLVLFAKCLRNQRTTCVLAPTKKTDTKLCPPCPFVLFGYTFLCARCTRTYSTLFNILLVVVLVASLRSAEETSVSHYCLLAQSAHYVRTRTNKKKRTQNCVRLFCWCEMRDLNTRNKNKNTDLKSFKRLKTKQTRILQDGWHMFWHLFYTRFFRKYADGQVEKSATLHTWHGGWVMDNSSSELPTTNPPHSADYCFFEGIFEKYVKKTLTF